MHILTIGCESFFGKWMWEFVSSHDMVLSMLNVLPHHEVRLRSKWFLTSLVGPCNSFVFCNSCWIHWTDLFSLIIQIMGSCAYNLSSFPRLPFHPVTLVEPHETNKTSGEDPKCSLTTLCNWISIHLQAAY